MITPEWKGVSLSYTGRHAETMRYLAVQVTVLIFQLGSNSYRSKTRVHPHTWEERKLDEIQKLSKHGGPGESRFGLAVRR